MNHDVLKDIWHWVWDLKCIRKIKKEGIQSDYNKGSRPLLQPLICFTWKHFHHAQVRWVIGTKFQQNLVCWDIVHYRCLGTHTDQTDYRWRWFWAVTSDCTQGLCSVYLPLLQASCRAEGKCVCDVCVCAPFCSSSSIQPTLPETQQLYRGVTPSMVAAFT